MVDLGEDEIAGLAARFDSPEFYLSEESIRRAIEQRSMFDILHPAGGLKLDIANPAESQFESS